LLLSAAIAVLAVLLRLQLASAAEPLHFAGTASELTISQISDRTVRLQLSPLDSKAQPLAAPPSTDLVLFKSAEKFRTRRLSGEKTVRAGDLRIIIHPNPLTISLRNNSSGRLVQQLTFDTSENATNSISFNTAAPVFGLGEGGPQFDRRGSLFRMINGQLTLLATHG